jgi:hypothetical protein
VHVPGPGEQPRRHVGRGQRVDRAEGGQDRAVGAAGQRHRHAGGEVVAHQHRAGVHSLGRQLVQHEPPGRVGPGHGGQGDPQAEPGGGDGGDRGRAADLQGDPVHQLLLLAEGRGHVRAGDQHVRVAVPDDQQVKVESVRR